MWTHNTAWTATATQTLAVAASGTNATIAQVDSMGNPSPITVTNGQVTLNLTEYPVYVISGDAATIESQVTVPEGYDPVL
jgi:hypothetical protein